MHAPISSEDLKALQGDDLPYESDIRDPALWKVLPLILAFLVAVGAAIALVGTPAITVLGLGGTAAMFVTIIYLTRG